MPTEERYFYKDHPQTCAPDDYWGQVKRTLRGKPVEAAQIDMIVAAIVNGLALSPDDRLLDLGCGNGALSNRVFDHCAGGLGVDFSRYLIDVARRDFARPPQREFMQAEALEFLAAHADTGVYGKAMCYGAFMFFDDVEAASFLSLLRRRFPNIRRLFLGNLPDKARMHQFFSDHPPTPGVEADPGSPIGVWRSRQEIEELARAAGWQTRFGVMPETFYAAAYRFDAVLTPAT